MTITRVRRGVQIRAGRIQVTVTGYGPWQPAERRYSAHGPGIRLQQAHHTLALDVFAPRLGGVITVGQIRRRR